MTALFSFVSALPVTVLALLCVAVIWTCFFLAKSLLPKRPRTRCSVCDNMGILHRDLCDNWMHCNCTVPCPVCAHGKRWAKITGQTQPRKEQLGVCFDCGRILPRAQLEQCARCEYKEAKDKETERYHSTHCFNCGKTLLAEEERYAGGYGNYTYCSRDCSDEVEFSPC